jgi:iron complex transport system permease protein
MTTETTGKVVIGVLSALLVLLFVASLMTGPAHLPPDIVLKALTGSDDAAGLIVRDIRLPRTILAVAIGATFGVAGAALQGLMRNPLAEPSLFGAPQAAAAASAAIMAFGFAGATSLAVPLGGIAGAFLSVGALVAIAGRRASLTVTLLAGLALASLAGAAVALILNLAPNPYIALEIAFWLLGSLRDRSMEHVALAGPFILASWVILALNARAFRALTLGEEAAASLGVNVGRTRTMVVIGVALGIGASVAVAGAISFVGLVAPHLVRRFYNSDPARVMLPAGLAGAVLLLAADIGVRLVPGPNEIKIGVVTAMIGVPFFLAMIFHERRVLEGRPS